MRVLSIDVETFCTLELRKVGLYKYVNDPSFQILLFAYAFDNDAVICMDLANGEELPQEVLDALEDPTVIKKAFNAMFERTAIGKLLGKVLDAAQWVCTMVKSAMVGLPMGLAQVSRALNLPQSKMDIGKQLIRYFCIPCKPTKANRMRIRNLSEHAPEKWAQFMDYCAMDVTVEKKIDKELDFYKITDKEKQLYILDQHINDRGVKLSLPLIEAAIRMDNVNRAKLLAEAVQLTGLENPNSGDQLKEWLSLEIDEKVSTLKADAIPKLIADCDDKIVKRVLRIRQETAKTSIKKYAAMLYMIGVEDRARGLLQFYGAGRTARWAGRGIQPQNLTKNKVSDIDLELARNLVLDGDLQGIELCFGSVSSILSQLIRTAFIAGEGKELIMSDFSAIEARVIAWLAKEEWRLRVFRTHGKIYEASGSAMFKVPIEEVKKGSVLRDKAKIAELALGFGGSVGALLRMGAEKMGLKESELKDLVAKWRDANKAIVRLWRDVNDAAVNCVATRQPQKVAGCTYYMKNGNLLCRLPSGRSLSYWKPVLKDDKFGRPRIWYWGVDQFSKQWKLISTYGGKLTENLVQAIARDLLAEKMLLLDEHGFEIVLHVHDEVIIEKEKGFADKIIDKVMSSPIEWAYGLPLNADSFVSPYYKKES